MEKPDLDEHEGGELAMGEHHIESDLEAEQLRVFMKHLLTDLRALERMLAEGWIESDRRRIGAEQELFIVDGSWRPALLATELLERLADPHYTTELGRFNIEFNLDPLRFEGDCLSRMEAELGGHVEKARRAARELGAEIVMTGILPTLQLSDLGLESMTPKSRYLALNRAMKELRGGAFEFYLEGQDELAIKHENVMLEACNTSFQVHFQVRHEDFARLYNMAQFLSAPVLAAATNSPLLFGQRLWRETRIGLFQQAVDTRSTGHQIQERLARVSFGQDWVNESVAEIFREDIARFRVVLGTDIEEDPFEAMRAGRPPELKALRLHNGTVYRWNRPCYGISEGKAHLRIENRYLPSGPSVVDEVANAAFWFGLMVAYTGRYGDIRRVFEFDDAKANFLAAARDGLRAQFTWLEGTTGPAQELILMRLLPRAHDGLEAAGIDAADIDRFLGIVEQRVSSGLTGATWLRRSFAASRDRGSKGNRLAALVAETVKNQGSGRPVHEWPEARMQKSDERISLLQRVESLMTTDLFTVNQDEVIDLVASMMDWKHIRHVPVEDNEGRLVGLVSYRRLLRVLATDALGRGPTTVPVHAIMQRNVIAISPETLVVDAIKLMRKERVACLPVLQNGRLVGIVTDHDFLELAAQLLDEKLEAETAARSRTPDAEDRVEAADR